MSDLFGHEEKQEERVMPKLPPRDLSREDTREGKRFDVRPLAERLRPGKLEDYLGQEQLLGEDGPLRRLMKTDQFPSMMLWGPPGSGKTTLARLLAQETQADFITLSAVTASISDVRSVIDVAKTNMKFQRRTILFIDEIHRFNKAQQDAFLPHVESGIITLIGATTENPSFSIISPLLSRSRVFVLKPMDDADLLSLLEKGIESVNSTLGKEAKALTATKESLIAISRLSDGDARRALGLLEVLSSIKMAEGGGEIGEADVRSVAQRHFIYDRNGEEHYNLISALHKTIRSSDPHGAVYWLTRMLAAGEDPLFLARRLVRIASEDIGLADPQALTQAMEGFRAYQLLGSPEGELALAQVAIYLALAPKSNAVYRAYNEARASAEEFGSLSVPVHLRNAPTKLMKSLDYGKDYSYDHDHPDGFIAKQGLPDELSCKKFFLPTVRGWEGELRSILENLDRQRNDNVMQNDNAEKEDK